MNHLVPVDARLERDSDVRFETVALDDVLAATTGASLRVVILDAARDDPLGLSRRTVTSAPAASALPLAAPLEFETLLAFSAGAGQMPSDSLGGPGMSRNSPFAAALLEYIETPVEVGLLFRQVRARVMQTTNGLQMPQVHMSLLREHYLSRPATAATVEAVSPEAADAADHSGRVSRNDAEAVAGRRVALVIGNAAYEEPDARLANSVGAARAAAEALNEAHFDEVFLRETWTARGWRGRSTIMRPRLSPERRRGRAGLEGLCLRAGAGPASQQNRAAARACRAGSGPGGSLRGLRARRRDQQAACARGERRTVSPRMLYEMAKKFDRREARAIRARVAGVRYAVGRWEGFR